MIPLGGTDALGVLGQVAWDAHGETTKRSTVRQWDGWMMGRTPAARALQCSRARMQGLHVWVDSKNWWPLPLPI
jgi:hypothetical protein